MNLRVASLFQFTHPGGVRREFKNIKPLQAQVSIHAPGRGATVPDSDYSAVGMFQFTHPGGVRLVSSPLRYLMLSFNSRTREGCDICKISLFLLKFSFNSRTREGCDRK